MDEKHDAYWSERDVVQACRRKSWETLYSRSDPTTRLKELKASFHSEAPAEDRVVAALACYLASVFHGELGKCKKDNEPKQYGEHPLHAELVRVLRCTSSTRWELATATLAVGEIEMRETLDPQTWAIRSQQYFEVMPGVSALLTWLDSKDEEKRIAALATIRFMACMLPSSVVPNVFKACNRLLDDANGSAYAEQLIQDIYERIGHGRLPTRVENAVLPMADAVLPMAEAVCA